MEKDSTSTKGAVLKNPDIKKNINNYLDLQREEYDIIDKELEGMLWVLKKAAV